MHKELFTVTFTTRLTSPCTVGRGDRRASRREKSFLATHSHTELALQLYGPRPSTRISTRLDLQSLRGKHRTVHKTNQFLCGPCSSAAAKRAGSQAHMSATYGSLSYCMASCPRLAVGSFNRPHHNDTMSK
jgi:hypothetical protein